MRVTRASDHTVTGLPTTRYCLMADVQRQVAKMEMGSDDLPLTNLLSSQEQAVLIAGYIEDARLWVEAPEQAGHDFEHHENVTVYVDGTGLYGLQLANQGFVPLLSVTSLSLDDSALVEETDFYVDSSGWVRGTLFTRGQQNVEMVLSWGYTSYPEDVQQAQAMKVVADLMRFIERSDSEDGKLPGGVNQIRFGNDLVIQASPGRYAKSIKDLEDQARKKCLRYCVVHAVGGIVY